MSVSVSSRSSSSSVSRDACCDDGTLSGRLLAALEGAEEVLNEAAPELLSFELRPELRLKLRKRTPLVTLGLNYLAGPPGGYEVVAKRGSADMLLWKARKRRCSHNAWRSPPVAAARASSRRRA